MKLSIPIVRVSDWKYLEIPFLTHYDTFVRLTKCRYRYLIGAAQAN